jgi:cytochrome c oxidase cbb3-type subunit 2
VHLYNSRAVSPGSTMPSYPFLFETKPAPAPGDVVVNMPEAYRPAEGVLVARPDALDLVQYLLELDRSYPVEEIPAAEAAE